MKTIIIFLGALIFSNAVLAHSEYGSAEVCGVNVKIENVTHPAQGVTVESMVKDIIRYFPNEAEPVICLVGNGTSKSIAVVTKSKSPNYVSSVMLFRL